MFFSSIEYYGIVFVLLIMLPVTVLSQVTIEGEYRPRTEFRSGYGMLRTSADDPAFFTSQRTRLNVYYNEDNYTFMVSGQDVRTWGEVDQLGDTPNVNIHEAWAQLNISNSIDIQLGRQELIYDDQRLLGSVNWAQQGRSHDAIRLKFHNKPDDFFMHIGGAYNQEREKLLGNSYSLSNYKVLSYLWMKKQVGAFNGSGFIITDGFEVPSGSVNYRYTYGANLDYASSPINLSGSFYLQSGDDNNRRNISAYM